MDNRPIGVFDSGLGGLTTVAKLMAVLPDEDIIYLGDTGRVPYGSRSKETIVKYTRQDIGFLRSFDIKAIVAACGTVSSTALDDIECDYDLPIYGVVRPAAVDAAEETKNGCIGLIGTEASIKSGAYDREIKAILPNARIMKKACPLLVPLVENGRVKRGDVVIETVVSEYLSDLKEAGVDTLIMGCTHYPLLFEIIGNFMGDGVRLINPGALAADYLAKNLRDNGLLTRKNTPRRVRFYVSDRVEGFAQMASIFLRREVGGAVEQVDLDQF